MPKKERDTLAYADNFNEGLRADVSADKAPEGSLVIAKNVRYIPGGGFYLRRGTDHVSSWVPGTSKPIEQFGKSMEHNILFIKSGAKIFQTISQSGSLYDILIVPLTAGERGQFVEYNSTMKYSNGTDDYFNINMGLVLTAFDQTATTITTKPGHVDLFPTPSSGTVTFTHGTEKVNWVSNPFANGDHIMFQVSGGSLPSELSTSTIYYVVNRAANDFQVALTPGGAAVEFTDNGSGTATATDGVLACEGNPISYTGKGTDSFTGCVVPVTNNYDAGAVITALNEVAGAPKAKVLESVFEKMVAGGVGTAEHAIYYTATANIDNPEYIDDWSTNGADQELFGKYGKITAMRTLLKRMYVAKDRGIESWTDIDENGIPVREPFDESYGIVNPDCMIHAGNKLVMLTTLGNIKTIEPDTTGVNPEPVINPFFDLKIRNTRRSLDIDQERARMGYNERDNLIRTTVERKNLLETIIYNTDTEGFSVDTGYAPGCWIEWNGVTYIGDANTDKVWVAESGYTDGTVAPEMVAATPIHYVGDRRRKVHVRSLFLTGLIKKKTTMVVYIYCDGVLHRKEDITGSASYVDTSSFRPFGLGSIGYSPMGRSGGKPGESDGFEFSVPIGINHECRNVQVVFTCEGVGYGVQIDSYELVPGDAPASRHTQQDTI